uniref:Hemicentin-1-like von Willebrand factor A domain-containing protein n=1 Tax=Plectus sambesii TaxID=2011161 RepID=A0A914VVL0_9BILA
MRWRPPSNLLLLLAAAILHGVVGQAAQGPPAGTSSLTFVFDKTGSMYDDLVQVREGAKKIFATVLEQREKLIYNYVLVPFHDPGQPSFCPLQSLLQLASHVQRFLGGVVQRPSAEAVSREDARCIDTMVSVHYTCHNCEGGGSVLDRRCLAQLAV